MSVVPKSVLPLVAIGLKSLAGGTLVVAFAVVSDVLKPKAFAGLFAAAPSVALTSLVITALTSGPSKAAISSRGMIAGAVGMIAYCVAASFLVKRFGAIAGSVMAWAAWIVAAFTSFWFFIR
jgi:uncharacterized membrane protein (GlpM family)